MTTITLIDPSFLPHAAAGFLIGYVWRRTVSPMPAALLAAIAWELLQWGLHDSGPLAMQLAADRPTLRGAIVDIVYTLAGAAAFWWGIHRRAFTK